MAGQTLVAEYFQATDPVVGRGHATKTDTTNRALRKVLSLCGISPDVVFTGFTPVYNVMAYGAIGDGIADDTAAIQAAITAAAAARGTVVIPRGTYKLTRATGILAGQGGGVLGSSLVLASNLAIEMQKGATLVQSSANTDTVYGSALSDVHLTNLVIQGVGGADVGNAIELFTITRLHITGCNIQSLGESVGVGGGGIVLTACDQVRVTGNYGLDCGYAFINIFRCTNFVVAQNTHKNTRGTAAGPVTCVYVGGGSTQCSDGSVVGNVAIDNNYSFQARVNVARVAFVGNIVRGELGVGITAQSSTGNPTTGVTVSGNIVQIAAGGFGGINFDGTEKCTCGDNVVDGPSTVAGINVNVTGTIQPDQITIRGNTVRNSASHGILTTAGSRITIAQNTVHCPTSGQRSITVSAGVTKSIVSQNTIVAANFHAVDCGANDCIVSGNIVDGTTNTGDGINVSGTGCLVVDNMCRGAIAGTPFNVTGAGSYKRNNSITNGARSGQAVLVAGTVTINTSEVRASDSIILSRVVTGGAAGHLSVGAIVSGTSFVINSSSGTDTSTIFWEIAR